MAQIPKLFVLQQPLGSIRYQYNPRAGGRRHNSGDINA
jgi:hypothetical protein